MTTSPLREIPFAIREARISRRRFVSTGSGALGLGAVALLSGCGSAVAPVPAATVPAFVGNGDPPLLVDATWLQERLVAVPAEPPRVVDLSPLREHRAGHVPGAIHGWWQDTMDPHYEVYGVVLKNREAPFTHAHVLGSLGIGDSTTAVFYDDDRNRYAARLVWYLRYLGHSAASVLDGGLAAWRGAGGEVEEDEREAPDAPPATIVNRGGIIGTQELSERLGDPSLTILDARTDDEAEDDLNGTIPLGQIPGTVRVPWTTTLRDDAGRLKLPEELAALYAAAGVAPEREIAVVARFGVETGQPWLVLSLLGYPRVRVYDQAWAEWASKPELPIDPLGPVAVA